MVACYDASFASSEGVRTCKLTMTDNLPAKNNGDWNKKILPETLYQAYVLLATHNFGCKVYNVYLPKLLVASEIHGETTEI